MRKLTTERILANKARREALNKAQDEREAPARALQHARDIADLKVMQHQMNSILKANGLATMNHV